MNIRESFKIEKNTLSREVLSGRRELLGLFPTLFSAIENDGSVAHNGSDGYEAITNILPLLPSSKWRNKIFNLIHSFDNLFRFGANDAH